MSSPLSDILTREVGRHLLDEIFRRAYSRSIWVDMLPASCCLREEWEDGKVRWCCPLHKERGPWITAYLSNPHTAKQLAEQFTVHQVASELLGEREPKWPSGLGETLSVVSYKRNP